MGDLADDDRGHTRLPGPLDTGVDARVAAALASAEADITHVDMEQETAQDAADLRFGVQVRDRVHLAAVMRSVRRTNSVLRVQRIKPGA